jgi:hypothetical protein
MQAGYKTDKWTSEEKNRNYINRPEICRGINILRKVAIQTSEVKIEYVNKCFGRCLEKR